MAGFVNSVTNLRVPHRREILDHLLDYQHFNKQTGKEYYVLEYRKLPSALFTK